MSNTNTTNNNDRKPKCWNCDAALEARIPRGLIVRTVFFWLPLQKYICLTCLSNCYVLAFKNSYFPQTKARVNVQPQADYTLSSSSTGQ